MELIVRNVSLETDLRLNFPLNKSLFDEDGNEIGEFKIAAKIYPFPKFDNSRYYTISELNKIAVKFDVISDFFEKRKVDFLVVQKFYRIFNDDIEQVYANLDDYEKILSQYYTYLKSEES